MSTDEYVPSDDQVRGRYCDGTYTQTGHTTEGDDFDAWLARVRRDAAADAEHAVRLAHDRAYKADIAWEDEKRRADQAEARIKAVENVLDKHETIFGADTLVPADRIRRALER